MLDVRLANTLQTFFLDELRDAQYTKKGIT